MAYTYSIRVRPDKDADTNGLFELLHIVKPEWEKNQISTKVRFRLINLLQIL